MDERTLRRLWSAIAQAKNDLRSSTGTLDPGYDAQIPATTDWSRNGAKLAYLGRCYFQGQIETDEIPRWGGLSDTFFEIADVFVRFNRFGFYRDDDMGKEMLRLVRRLGFPTLRSFWCVLYAYGNSVEAYGHLDGHYVENLDQARENFEILSAGFLPVFGAKHERDADQLLAKVEENIASFQASRDRPAIFSVASLRALRDACEECLSELPQLFEDDHIRDSLTKVGPRLEPFNDESRRVLRAYWLHHVYPRRRSRLTSDLRIDESAPRAEDVVSERLSKQKRWLKGFGELRSDWQFNFTWLWYPLLHHAEGLGVLNASTESELLELGRELG